MDNLKKAMDVTAGQLESILERMLNIDDAPEEKLISAMRHAALGGGKRFRPFLVMETAKLFSVAERSAARTAAALEFVHCYSLVHDDLPAMDNDDLRRGKPTVHIAFNEATAILAGDALLTMAFEVLAHQDTHDNPNVRAELVCELAKASGSHGMLGGQMIDLNAADNDLDIGAITRLQRLKTGRLIDFACIAPCILGNAPAKCRDALRGYTRDLGLAFQIADDLLDVEGTAHEMGKAVGKDDDHGKATFVSILGIERAKDQAELLSNQAIEHLAIFDEKADLLREVARFVVERRS